MAATIHDIAHKVGVNASTVSRVLNGKTTISNETKERIYAAMQELDYHPNSVARSLANGLSGAIGVVVDAENSRDFSNLFFNRSLFAIERIAQAEGYHVIIANHAKHGSKPSPVENLMLERKVDGLILPPSILKPKLMEKLEEQQFPCVVLGRPNNIRTAANWVDVNNAQGSALAVQHLLAQGYKHIAYLGGRGDSGFVKQRVSGYSQALSGKPYLVLPTNGTAEDAQAIVTQWFASEPAAIDAFVCNDNLTAYGLLRAMHAMQLAVPAQMGIVTFDNYPLAEYMEPPLTAVDVDTDLLGEQAARLLFQRIQKPMANQQILLNTALIVRGSTTKD